MPLVINTNVAALNSQRQLVKSGNDMAEAMERLSSGRRINTAADDAAGLAIANRQTSQIRGLDQAIRNANDGVSLIQTAEGALDETTNILQRMRELAIQSANGIYSDADRSTLDAEVQQLKAELDRISETTSFNGQKVLDGTLGDVELQIGSEANETVSFSVQASDIESLGGASSADVVGATVTNGLTVLADITGVATTGTNSLIINDVNVGSLTSATLTDLNDYIGAMNSSLEVGRAGVEVSASVELNGSSVGAGELSDAAGTFVTIALVDGDGLTTTYNISDTANLEELADKINSASGGNVKASIGDDGRLSLLSEGATSITVTDATGASGLKTTVENFRLNLTDTNSEDGNDEVSIQFGTGSLATIVTNDSMASELGLDARAKSDITSGVVTGTAAVLEGDLVVNGVEIGSITPTAASAAALTSAIVAAVNDVSAETGVVASVINSDGTVGAAVTSYTLNTLDGSEISIDFAGTTATALLLGIQETNVSSATGDSVAGIDISTAAGAQDSIEVIDVALEQINASRSELGAVTNRLEFTMSNLMNVSENTSAARSRIVDADFAAETANLSRAQVLQQASQAMLAQANAQPQQVLQLLNG
ncbi:MAG: flagellar biosynthesis protein FliC [Cellvibrionaceae bacterium]|nr:flagellar biosynthesis protein FliC [Cellvibrionaceae bacterium]|tara:strand:- start:48570 stop:50372 length:1803 start_codon:yes stop_codon:yes gene_type:complete